FLANQRLCLKGSAYRGRAVELHCVSEPQQTQLEEHVSRCKGGATMAGREKQKNQAKRQRDRRASPRQAPKMKVIEAGEAEQGAPCVRGRPFAQAGASDRHRNWK